VLGTCETAGGLVWKSARDGVYFSAITKLCDQSIGATKEKQLTIGVWMEFRSEKSIHAYRIERQEYQDI
jgi:arabinogalactan endo-1,4-beta-galactosidase